MYNSLMNEDIVVKAPQNPNENPFKINLWTLLEIKRVSEVEFLYPLMRRSITAINRQPIKLAINVPVGNHGAKNLPLKADSLNLSRAPNAPINIAKE